MIGRVRGTRDIDEEIQDLCWLDRRVNGQRDREGP